MRNKSGLLYQTIINDIKNAISSGKYKPGDKLPTEYELAQIYNVSRITVTRATKELENENLVYKVKGTGTFIKDANDKPASNQFKFISVIIPFKEKWFFDILSGAEDELKKWGYYVSYNCTNYNPKEERELIINLSENNAMGFIIYPSSTFANIDLYSSLIIRNKPIVFVDRTIELIDAPSVTSNNFDAGYNITKLLIDNGHIRIGFVGHNIHLFNSSYDRYKGFCKALIDNGIEINSNYLFDDYIAESGNKEFISIYKNPHSIESAKKVLTSMLSQKPQPTAIMALNDVIAIALVKAAMELGISIPDQLSITGFDNLILQEQLPINLTTVAQHFDKMGAAAAKMLLTKIKQPNEKLKNQVIDTEIIIKDSVKDIRNIEQPN
jgi:DNA-binding LacI/PurR family transcriptional regulator